MQFKWEWQKIAAIVAGVIVFYYFWFRTEWQPFFKVFVTLIVGVIVFIVVYLNADQFWEFFSRIIQIRS